MKTTVLGIRLNDYQREKLESKARDLKCQPTELVRILIDKLIEGRIQLSGLNCDLSGLDKIAKEKDVSTQTLIDYIVEQINGSTE